MIIIRVFRLFVIEFGVTVYDITVRILAAAINKVIVISISISVHRRKGSVRSLVVNKIEDCGRSRYHSSLRRYNSRP